MRLEMDLSPGSATLIRLRCEALATPGGNMHLHLALALFIYLRIFKLCTA